MSINNARCDDLSKNGESETFERIEVFDEDERDEGECNAGGCGEVECK